MSLLKSTTSSSGATDSSLFGGCPRVRVRGEVSLQDSENWVGPGDTRRRVRTLSFLKGNPVEVLDGCTRDFRQEDTDNKTKSFAHLLDSNLERLRDSFELLSLFLFSVEVFCHRLVLYFYLLYELA